MSRSTTYRPVELTEEEAAEIAARLRSERFRTEVLPGLRDQLLAAAEELHDGRDELTDEIAMLTDRITVADTMDELGALSAEVNAVRSNGVGLAAVDSVMLDRRRADDHSRQLLLDAERLVIEIASCRRISQQFDLDLAELTALEQGANAAKELARRGDHVDAQRVLESLTERFGLIDEQIADAAANAACRTRAIAAVRDALESMGFATQDPTGDTTSTIVRAHARDGRTAAVVVSPREVDVEVASTFTDARSAVPGSHPQAGAVCEDAVVDQAAFHRALQRTPGLRALAIRVQDQPTRGSASASGDNAGRRPTKRSESPAQQRRRS